jgi:hypothetical protein
LSHLYEGTNFHEAIACGTGCDDVLRRRIRTRFNSGLAVGAPGVGVGSRSGEIRDDQEGQEEEGEEAGELLEHARCRANEVDIATLSVPNPTKEDSK